MTITLDNIHEHELDFINYLESADNSTFTLVAPKGVDEWGNSQTIVKVTIASNDLVLLYEVDKRVNNAHLYTAPDEMRFFGVYIPQQQTLLLYRGYRFGNLNNFFKTLNVYEYGDVLKELYSVVEVEFANRHAQFEIEIEQNRSWQELWDYRSENEESVVMSVIKDEYENGQCPKYYSDRFLEQHAKFLYAQDFIINREETVKKLADNYTESTGKLIENKFKHATLCKTVRKQILGTTVYKKARAIHHLFNTELKDAKFVWVELVGGEAKKEKVEPYLHYQHYRKDGKDTKDLMVGRWKNEVEVELVRYIKYGHKTYDLLEVAETLMDKHEIDEPFLEIEGVPVVFLREGRVSKGERHDHLHYYDMRHGDNDWSEPVTLERGVMCNFFGTLATTKPIQSLHTDDKHAQIIFDDMPDKDEVINAMLDNRD